MGERVLVLLRHGEPAYDPADTDDDGNPDGPLSGAGQAQVAAAAARLQGAGIATIHAGSLRRTRHTAELVHEQVGLPVRVRDVLREVIPNVPPAEVLSPSQREFFAPERWPAGVLDASAVRARAQLAEFTSVPDSDTTELLVTHGNVIAWFVASALGAPPWAWVTMPTHDYAALTAIVYRTGRPASVLAYNDAGHLPPDLRGLELPTEWRI